jgi:type III secretion protein V
MGFLRTALTRHGAEVGLAAAVVLTVGMMIVPLPTWVLDLLLATNLTFSVLLLLVASFVRDALSFGAFPTLLLVTTLFRLALNVSSTRLILLQADAGEVIRAFGELVVRGDYVVGAVVFLILTVIQLVVIARGSERVAEVGARFTLDAMPGKQLAIDADLRAGVLDAEGAAERRRALERESQLYGAMDGAMKFVKGDAIAGIVIIAVNILGGLAIGVLARDLPVGTALQTYGLLTIGDGLVSQIPALLISTAAGLVVTRVASEHASGTLGSDVGAQVFGDWRALAVAAVFAALLAVVPGLPLAPFAVLSVLLGGLALVLYRRRPMPDLAPSTEDAPAPGPLELRTGARLARQLADDARFAEGLVELATALHDELGVRLPTLRPRVASTVDPDGYVIALAAVPADRGRCPAGKTFVRGAPEALRALDPAVELDGDGGWIDAALTTRARALGHASVEPTELLVSRLRDVVRAQPEHLVGLQETQRELDLLAREAPALVRTVVPDRVPLPRLTALLRALLSERVSVRPLREILEALALDPLPPSDAALVETIRARLARQLTHALRGDRPTLDVVALDPLLEEGLRSGLRPERDAALDPELVRDLLGAVERALPEAGVIVTQPDVRSALRRVLAPSRPDVAVVSYRELDPSVQVRRLGVVSP